MTHPGEVGLDWAMNRTKPNFVGRRSVDILAASAPIRQLVGFSLDLTAPKPLEGHLVIKGGVTSRPARFHSHSIRSSAWPMRTPMMRIRAIALRFVPRMEWSCRRVLKPCRSMTPTTRGKRCEPAQSARRLWGDRGTRWASVAGSVARASRGRAGCGCSGVVNGSGAHAAGCAEPDCRQW